ncbi:isochorismate synthase [Halostagnicola larsenii XH-48]|uniref:isochorismate synthase n=1 Tax=Halostagnicola larsenii XH-48 TaxID=797299 RepID=W0JR07_9EURY|nr:isochorismate synthase [Halostagnicola larsenii]AHF99402.1 isochorismate synthase [Halostagnicola larsenii XH-48]
MERPSGGWEVTGTLERDAPEYHSASRELEEVSFGAIVDAEREPRLQWAAPDGLEVAGTGVAKRFRASGPNRFDDLRADAGRAFDRLEYDGPEIARPRAFGGVSFHDGHEPAGSWDGFDAASFVIPAVQVTRSDDGVWLTATAASEDDVTERLEQAHARLEELPAMRPSGNSPGVDTTTRSTTPAEWTEQVETALERIEQGELTKVVLAQSLSATLDGAVDVPATLERLRRTYPNCYRFSFAHETGGTFFGTPPERLVAKRGRTVETEALAGSVPRGDDPESDDEFAATLRDSEKVGREHGLVAEAIREQLDPLAESVTASERTIRRLATIQHLRTPITATLERDCHVLEIVEALHPTPAVGGVPPSTAWETIRSTESFDRGWYAAPIGWFDGNGDGEFAVGIRSAIADDRSVTLFAGNGIVADSDPADEWEEVQLKFRPILDELQ